MTLVDFVVCARNNRDIIGETLESIERQTITARTCCVVDGRSTDGTPDYVRLHFPWVKVVTKDQDSGPGASRNLGCSLGNAKYVVWVDSDVTLDSDWTEQQLRFFEANQRVGMLCGKLLYAPAPGMLHTAYGKMNRFGVGWDGAIGEPADAITEPLPCLWANTTAVAVRREMIERIGGFDEELYAYYEDGDLGWRANLFGYTVMSNPEAVATHRHHGTSRRAGEPTAGSPSAVYLIWRNRLRVTFIHYEWPNVLRYLVPYFVLSLGNAVLKPPRPEKIRALWWNAVHLGSTLQRRRYVQKNRVVRDRELWHLFEPGLFGPGYWAVEKAAQAFAGGSPRLDPME